MNRKLIVSILAIILVITMILSLVLAALPARAFAHTAVTVRPFVCTALGLFTGTPVA